MWMGEVGKCHVARPVLGGHNKSTPTVIYRKTNQPRKGIHHAPSLHRLPQSLHLGRTPGGDRHHRHLAGSVAARCPGSEGSRSPDAVQEQPQANRTCDAQLPKHRGCVPTKHLPSRGPGSRRFRRLVGTGSHPAVPGARGNLYSHMDFSITYEKVVLEGRPISTVRIPTYLCPSEVNDQLRLDAAGKPFHWPLNYVFNMGVWFVWNPIDE